MINTATWYNQAQTQVMLTDGVNNYIITRGSQDSYDNELTAYVEAGGVIAPFVFNLAQEQNQVIGNCNVYANRYLNKFLATFSQSFSNSWQAQLTEAKIVQAGETLSAPSLLQALVTAANSPSVTLASVAQNVITNVTNYQNVLAAFQIFAETISSTVLAVTNPTVLPDVETQLNTQADALAKQLGIGA